MSGALTRNETLGLFILASAGAGVLWNTLQGDGNPLSASLALSAIAFAATYSLITWLGESFMKVGLKGKDMSKIRKIEMYVRRTSLLTTMYS